MAFFRLMIVFFVIPSSLFLIVNEYYFLTRAIVNFDYIIIAMWVALCPPALNISIVIGIATALVFDLFFSISPGYHFTPRVAVENLFEVSKLEPGFLILAVVGISLSIIFISWVAAKFAIRSVHDIPTGKRVKISGMLLLLAGFLILADGVLRDYSVTNDGRKNSSIDLITSGAVRFSKAFYTDIYLNRSASLAIRAWAPETASYGLFDAMRGESILPQNILFVMVESLGEFKNDKISDAQLAPILSEVIQAHFTVERGVVEFAGATVSAEFRELCGVELQSYPRNSRDVAGLECLPKLFAERGYETRSYHGYSGALFNRVLWYGELGFLDSLFAVDLYGKGVRQCGQAFKGVCDNDVVRMLKSDFLNEGARKQFTYMLSLDAHLPSGRPASSPHHMGCGTIEDQKMEADICILLNHHRSLLGELASLAIQMRNNDFLLIVVGDHSPPYLSGKMRDLFVDGVVPYLILSPRK